MNPDFRLGVGLEPIEPDDATDFTIAPHPPCLAPGGNFGFRVRFSPLEHPTHPSRKGAWRVRVADLAIRSTTGRTAFGDNHAFLFGDNLDFPGSYRPPGEGFFPTTTAARLLRGDVRRGKLCFQ